MSRLFACVGMDETLIDLLTDEKYGSYNSFKRSEAKAVTQNCEYSRVSV